MQQRMRILLLLACLVVVLQCFTVPSPTTTRQERSRVVVMESKKWRQKIDEKSRLKALGSGTLESNLASLLGGLFFGPLGVVYFASVGNDFGKQNAFNRARQEEMKRLGLSQDMLDSAEQVDLALEQCMQGLQQVRASLDSQQRLARRLDQDEKELYEKAKTAMANNQEEEARKYLLQRESVEVQLKDALGNCATAKQQVAEMEENAAGFERRAMEIEALLERTVSAKTMQNADSLSLADSDPLLRKFKDLGID